MRRRETAEREQRWLQLLCRSRWFYLDEGESKRLWYPFLIISRLKKESPQVEGTKMRTGTAITHSPDARLYTEVRSIVTINCDMAFQTFPFDQHECYFEVFTTLWLTTQIREFSLQVTLAIPSDKALLSDFDVNGKPAWGRAISVPNSLEYEISFSGLPDDLKCREHVFFSGYSPLYQVAGFTMTMKRQYTPFLFNYYLPSGLLVVISWGSFAIPPGVIPGRIALIVTTFLSLVNIANSAFSNFPIAQGVNYMQVMNE